MSSKEGISNICTTNPRSSLSPHLQRRESVFAAMNHHSSPSRYVQQNNHRLSESPRVVMVKRKLSVSSNFVEITDYEFNSGKMSTRTTGPQHKSSPIMSKPYKARDNKHQRLQYELINQPQLYIRSPSPQYSQTVIEENENYIATTDGYHIYLHEPEKPQGHTLTPSLGNLEPFLAGNDHDHGHALYHEDMDPCYLNSSPPALSAGFSSEEEYCKYCDDVHGARGCQVLCQTASKTQANRSIASTNCAEGNEQSVVDTWTWGGQKTFDTDTNTWHQQAALSTSFAQNEQFKSPATPQEDSAPIYQARGPSPKIISPKPVRPSPETVENRLLVNHCKNCGATCCRGKPTCQVLYKGETCAKCGHKGCLDFLDQVAEKGMPGRQRREDGFVIRLRYCQICGRQDCGDLIPPECTRVCGNQLCVDCNGIESGPDEGVEMLNGDCRHGDCTACQLTRSRPWNDVAGEKEACVQCGEVDECIPLKTLEEWARIWYNDPQVKEDRDFKVWIRRLGRRMGR